MFYPFTAHMAKKETIDAKIAQEGELDVLLQAHLSIAHVYIQRAARSGYTKTTVYCPYSIREDFKEFFVESGFEVAPCNGSPSRYWVSWGES